MVGRKGRREGRREGREELSIGRKERRKGRKGGSDGRKKGEKRVGLGREGRNRERWRVMRRRVEEKAGWESGGETGVGEGRRKRGERGEEKALTLV